MLKEDPSLQAVARKPWLTVYRAHAGLNFHGPSVFFSEVTGYMPRGSGKVSASEAS